MNCGISWDWNNLYQLIWIINMNHKPQGCLLIDWMSCFPAAQVKMVLGAEA